ncbi:MAG TPA: hypothetical protein VF815_05035, partial [Myxococcaceae bacterium]
MRHMAGWVSALWLVVGCTVPAVGELPGTCRSDEDCPSGALCDEGSGICHAADVELPDGEACTPACAEYEACTLRGCQPRFTGLNILSPDDGTVLSGSTDGGVDGGGAVQVVAELMANPLFTTTQFPPSLSFSASLSGSGEAGTFGAVTRDGGRYSVPWTPPMVQGLVTLTAAHPNPAVGLSDTVNVTVDSAAPTFTIAFSAPAARAQASPVQASQQDPAGGYELAFRRDESVTVTISANEAISRASLTVIGIGPAGATGQAQPPVILQPGGTCPGTPAFCSTVTVDLSVPEMRDFR